MEKIMMNDIIAFVNKAIKNNMYIDTDEECSITIINNDKLINFLLEEDYMLIKTDNGSISFYVDNKEDLQFKLLIENCIEYCEKKGFEDFNNFFKEDSKPTDINDLDNEDD